MVRLLDIAARPQYLHDSIKNITHKQLVDTFAVNVYSAFFMTQACLPHMRRGGAIINTSSVAAYKGRYDMCVLPSWTRHRCSPACADVCCVRVALPQAGLRGCQGRADQLHVLAGAVA